MGILLERDELRLSSIRADTPAGQSPLREGDEILSINNQDCSRKDSESVGFLLQRALGYVTIVVQNHGGASDLVESMAQKSHKEPLGIVFKDGPNNSVLVSQIRQGPFSNSLLNQGDQLLTINGESCANMNATQVVQQLRSSPGDTMTLLTKTERETGVVVAEVSSRLAANHGPTTMPPRSSARQDEEEAKNRKVICLCVRFVILLVLIGSLTGGFSTASKSKDTNNGDDAFYHPLDIYDNWSHFDINKTYDDDVYVPPNQSVYDNNDDL